MEKLLSCFRFYIFSGNEIGFEKNKITNGWGYAEIQKQTNTDEEPKIEL
jgi:hypothetical protein